MCRRQSPGSIRIRRIPGRVAKRRPGLVRGSPANLVAQRPGERPAVAPRHDLDHDPAVLDALDRLVTRVDRELFTNRLGDRDLATISYQTNHDMNCTMRSHSIERTRLGAQSAGGSGRRGSTWD